MDIETIIANVAVLSIVLVPYFILMYISHKQYNEVGKRFQQEVNKYGLHIDTYERWNTNAMGMDDKQQIILLVTKRNEQLIVETFPLGKIKQSAILVSSHAVKKDKKSYQQLDKVFLELTPYDSSNNILIPLFDSDITFEEDYEMKRAEKWNRLINSSIVAPIAKSKAA